MKRIVAILLSFAQLAVIVPLVTFLSGCDALTESGPSRLVISLVDSPADYQAVNVDIQEISLKTNGNSEDDGWITLDAFTPGIYNILEFTGGNELLLADMEFPAGEITQIRLKLGQKNSLISNDFNSTLAVPSGSSSGLKFNVNTPIKGGETNYLKLDFDAARSIVKLGNSGQFLLKPVIKLFSENSTGKITGKIMPANENVLINVIKTNHIVASSYATSNASKFLVPGIEEGIYTVSIEISGSNYQKILHDVSIRTGKTTELGTINMNED